jgi:hypothetical protein
MNHPDLRLSAGEAWRDYVACVALTCGLEESTLLAGADVEVALGSQADE